MLGNKTKLISNLIIPNLKNFRKSSYLLMDPIKKLLNKIVAINSGKKILIYFSARNEIFIQINLILQIILWIMI